MRSKSRTWATGNTDVTNIDICLFLHHFYLILFLIILRNLKISPNNTVKNANVF